MSIQQPRPAISHLNSTSASKAGFSCSLRALARLREVTGDPLLVRAGRGLTPTPRAVLLRGQVGPVLLAAQQLLQPAAALDVAGLTRTFTLDRKSVV